MTKRQKQQRRMAAPTPKPEANGLTRREIYLLAELRKIGYTVAPVAPYQFFITKAGAA